MFDRPCCSLFRSFFDFFLVSVSRVVVFSCSRAIALSLSRVLLFSCFPVALVLLDIYRMRASDPVLLLLCLVSFFPVIVSSYSPVLLSCLSLLSFFTFMECERERPCPSFVVFYGLLFFLLSCSRALVLSCSRVFVLLY